MRRVVMIVLAFVAVATNGFASSRRRVAPREIGPVLYRIPVDGVTALAATADGSVWYLPDFLDPPFVGRLTRYNGIEVTSLVASQLGPETNEGLWMVSHSGLVIIGHDNTESTYPITTGYISAMTLDAQDRLWFANRDANLLGYFDYAGQKVIEYPLPASLASPKFVAPGPDGNMWVVGANGTIATVSSNGGATLVNLPETHGQPITAVAATPTEFLIAIGCRPCNRVSCPFPNDRGLVIGVSAEHRSRTLLDVGHNNIYALAAGQDGTVYALKAILSVYLGGNFYPGPLLVIRRDGSIVQLSVPVETPINGASGGMLALARDGAVWGAYTSPNTIFRFPAWQVR